MFEWWYKQNWKERFGFLDCSAPAWNVSENAKKYAIVKNTITINRYIHMKWINTLYDKFRNHYNNNILQLIRSLYKSRNYVFLQHMSLYKLKKLYKFEITGLRL